MYILFVLGWTFRLSYALNNSTIHYFLRMIKREEKLRRRTKNLIYVPYVSMWIYFIRLHLSAHTVHLATKKRKNVLSVCCNQHTQLNRFQNGFVIPFNPVVQPIPLYVISHDFHHNWFDANTDKNVFVHTESESTPFNSELHEKAGKINVTCTKLCVSLPHMHTHKCNQAL